MRVTRTVVGALVLLGLIVREGSPAPPSAGALAGWDAYVKATEARIDAELARGQPFLAQDVLVPTRSAETERLGRNERPVFIQRMPETTRDGRRIEAPGAMLHHWLGSILVPHVQVQTVIDFVQDYDHHARVFEDVVESKLLARQGDRFEAFLKLRRTKVLTVYYNTVHLVDYRTHDASRASSRSVATKIAELDRPGTLNEREKSPAEERGFMWRLNSYWRFLQVPSGVIVECESISLSRDIPLLLQWIVRPFVTAVPRESLERTLTSIRAGAVARREKGSPTPLSVPGAACPVPCALMNTVVPSAEVQAHGVSLGGQRLVRVWPRNSEGLHARGTASFGGAQGTRHGAHGTPATRFCQISVSTSR